MGRKDVRLRPAQERDRAAILRMNEENVIFNSHGTMKYSNTLVLESGYVGVE